MTDVRGSGTEFKLMTREGSCATWGVRGVVGSIGVVSIDVVNWKRRMTSEMR